jgi:hypothetical protein
MDTVDIEVRKEELRQKLQALIQEFENQTECKVSFVDTKHNLDHQVRIRITVEV